MQLALADFDTGDNTIIKPLMNLCAATPGQKLRIAFYILDEVVHIVRAIRHQRTFPDYFHEKTRSILGCASQIARRLQQTVNQHDR